MGLCQLIRLARLKTQLLLSVTQHQLPVPPRKRGLKLNLHRHRKRSPPKRPSPFPRKVGGVRCAMMVITAIWKRRPRLLQPAMTTVQLTRDVPVATLTGKNMWMQVRYFPVNLHRYQILPKQIILLIWTRLKVASNPISSTLTLLMRTRWLYSTFFLCVLEREK